MGKGGLCSDICYTIRLEQTFHTKKLMKNDTTPSLKQRSIWIVEAKSNTAY